MKLITAEENSKQFTPFDITLRVETAGDIKW